MHISKTPIFCVILSSLLNAANGAPIGIYDVTVLDYYEADHL